MSHVSARAAMRSSSTSTVTRTRTRTTRARGGDRAARGDGGGGAIATVERGSARATTLGTRARRRVLARGTASSGDEGRELRRRAAAAVGRAASANASASASANARRPRVDDGTRDGAVGDTAFERSGGLLYVRNFFEPETFERVAAECEKLRASVTPENRACARQRLGVMVPSDNFVHEACVASSVSDRLRSLLLGENDDAGALVAGDVPVEFRVYPVGGSMDWHKDVALYTKPQYEIVFTVTNTSDSTTEWEDERTGMRYGGWTEPNSVIIVRADGAPHRVTGVTRGERSIIKFVLTQTLEKTDDFFDNLLIYT